MTLQLNVVFPELIGETVRYKTSQLVSGIQQSEIKGM